MEKEEKLKKLLSRLRDLRQSPYSDGYTMKTFEGECERQGCTYDEVIQYEEQKKQERKEKRMQNKALEITEDMVATSSMQCLKCGTHLTKDDAYFKIQGNIFVGEQGGIIGGTSDSESRFCMNCLIKELERVRDEEIDKLKEELARKEAKLADLIGRETPDLDIPGFLS